MKNLVNAIVIALLALTSMTAGQELSTNELYLRSQISVPEPPTAEWNRGPNQTRAVNYQGVGFVYQEGVLGAEWAQLNGPGRSIGSREINLSISPTALFGEDGKAGVGANINLQLADVVAVNHTSHFGAMERHITTATLAPRAPVSVQAIRIATAGGSVTRVGPSVRLGENANLWYWVSTDGSPSLFLATGNVRF